MEKSQIDEISDLLLSYSAGHYHVKGEVSENFDEIDMIISGINMLGEELRSTNVSKEYFSSIFNAVTDLVMVANENGILLDLNEAVGNVLGYSQEELLGNSIFKILNPQNQHVFSNLKEELAKNIKNYIFEGELIKSDKELVFGLFTCSKIFDRAGSFNGYLVSVKDITAQKENEKLILKTIISTQGAEQRRVADDLHDSLGQELSMAQLMLSNLNRFKVEDKEFYKVTNGGHTWPGSAFDIGETTYDFNASKEIWRFFSQYSMIELTSGVAEEEAGFSFDIYPNPTNESAVTLNFSSLDDKLITVTNLMGQVIFQKSVSQTSVEINLENQGIYLVTVEAEGQIWTEKIIRN